VQFIADEIQRTKQVELNLIKRRKLIKPFQTPKACRASAREAFRPTPLFRISLA